MSREGRERVPVTRTLSAIRHATVSATSSRTADACSASHRGEAIRAPHSGASTSVVGGSPQAFPPPFGLADSSVPYHRGWVAAGLADTASPRLAPSGPCRVYPSTKLAADRPRADCCTTPSARPGRLAFPRPISTKGQASASRHGYPGTRPHRALGCPLCSGSGSVSTVRGYRPSVPSASGVARPLTRVLHRFNPKWGFSLLV
jgi:hypothetical protein